MEFKRRYGEFEQGCVLSESYTATDAFPLILPACRQPLLPACVFVTRDTVRHLRLFFLGKFVREPICAWWEAFMNRFVRDKRRLWTGLFVMVGVHELICSWWEAFMNRGSTVPWSDISSGKLTVLNHCCSVICDCYVQCSRKGFKRQLTLISTSLYWVILIVSDNAVATWTENVLFCTSTDLQNTLDVLSQRRQNH
jgi:hypothetical protein